MKHGPLLFLGVFTAVFASWVAGVLAPHVQIGGQSLVQIDELGIQYPLDRTGEAKQGAEIYRAQGCHYCHTQQVLQEPLLSRLTLTDAGTNIAEVVATLRKVRRDLDADTAAALVSRPPQVVLAHAGASATDQATRLLTNAGAQVESTIANLGPDLRRGWGTRRTVSRDYLRDEPVFLGQIRLGPDLANLGARQTNTTWLLRKLYNARIELPGSTMPRYPYLFTERRLRPGQAPSPDALALPPEFAPPPGIEIIPTREARQLVAYLLSLRSDALFYEVFPPKPQTTTTNAVSAPVEATNAPPTQTSSLDLRPSDFPLRTSDFDLRPSDFDLRPSDFDLRPSDFALRTSPLALASP
ncbi:MAG: cbb3-type cytochrome c oxidase subunit II [Verrucomicrobiales bacterium]|nr:cbb3-type cytochrome c oxidase subunit II [Verrucomicrobiales bacterium]